MSAGFAFRWRFVVDGEVSSPGNSQKALSPKELPVSLHGAKRKSSEPSPAAGKRTRTSDGQTDWVVKNVRLVQQLEVSHRARKV